jgi:hypothetical protein
MLRYFNMGHLGIRRRQSNSFFLQTTGSIEAIGRQVPYCCFVLLSLWCIIITCSHSSILSHTLLLGTIVSTCLRSRVINTLSVYINAFIKSIMRSTSPTPCLFSLVSEIDEEYSGGLKEKAGCALMLVVCLGPYSWMLVKTSIIDP